MASLSMWISVGIAFVGIESVRTESVGIASVRIEFAYHYFSVFISLSGRHAYLKMAYKRLMFCTIAAGHVGCWQCDWQSNLMHCCTYALC